MAKAEPVPVSVITGFLGSGKTTLLSHLLRRPDMGRTAVILNEFGEVGLDHDLVSSATDDTSLMDSGCLCCTIRGDRSEQRRVGKDAVSTFRSRGAPSTYKTNNTDHALTH